MSNPKGRLFELMVADPSPPGGVTGTVRLLVRQDNHEPYLRVKAMAKVGKFYQPIYKAISEAIRIHEEDWAEPRSFSIDLTYCPLGAQSIRVIVVGGRGQQATADVPPPAAEVLQEPPLWWRLLNAHRLGGG